MDEIDVLLDVIGDAPDPILLGEVLLAKRALRLSEGCFEVNAVASLVQHLCRDVGGVHAKIRTRCKPRFHRQHYDAVGFFAARASGRPDRDRASRTSPTAHEGLGNDLANESSQLAPLSKKVGLVRCQLVDQSRELAVSARAAANLIVIGREARKIEFAQAPCNPLFEQESRIGGKIEAAPLAQEFCEHAELRIRHSQIIDFPACDHESALEPLESAEYHLAHKHVLFHFEPAKNRRNRHDDTSAGEELKHLASN